MALRMSNPDDAVAVSALGPLPHHVSIRGADGVTLRVVLELGLRVLPDRRHVISVRTEDGVREYEATGDFNLSGTFLPIAE